METKGIVSKIPTFTVGVLVFCIASSKATLLASLFIYDREAILNGELWRLVTSHFVHFNDIHLIYNLTAFGVIGWLIEYKGHCYFKLLYLLMACSISAVMIVFKPDMSFFGGLSGIVCGSVAYFSLQCLREQTPWRNISILAIIFLFVKVVLEIYTSGSLLPYWGIHDFIPIPISHGIGILTAFIFFFLVQKSVLMGEFRRLLRHTPWRRSTIFLLCIFLSAAVVRADHEDPLYPIFENNHWGLIDQTGKVILAPKFDQIGKSTHGWIPDTWEFEKLPNDVSVEMTMSSGDPVTGRVIPIRLNGQFGLATRQGEVYALGKYENIDWRFRDDLLEVSSGDRIGFADDRGELVIPCQFDEVRGFKGGYAFVKKAGHWGIIDRTGQVIVAPIWDQVDQFTREGLTAVRIGDKLGMVKLNGETAIPIKFDKIIGSPSASLMPVVDSGRLIYVRPDGHGTFAFELTCPEPPKRLFGFLSGSPEVKGLPFWAKSAIVRCGKHYGLVNAKGQFLLEPVWDDIKTEFRDGRTIVKSGKAMGIIDEDGHFILEPSQEFDISSYFNGIAIFSRHPSGLMGAFNVNGQIVFELPLEKLLWFEDGIAVARQPAKDGKPQRSGYIDKNGNWAIAPRFHMAEPFTGPLAYVEQPVSDRITEGGYINRKGEVVYRRKFTGFVWGDCPCIDPSGLGQ